MEEEVEERKFTVIAVISKATNTVIKIKDYRFNSEYHEKIVEAEISEIGGNLLVENILVEPKSEVQEVEEKQEVVGEDTEAKAKKNKRTKKS